VLSVRYHQILTFGHGTIRHFPSNASEMKKLAQRVLSMYHMEHQSVYCSYLLQCSIPAFEGLLDGQHDRRLMKLLYRMSEWHALAKLRMHTEDSLVLMEEITKELGQLLRQFRQLTCSQFCTVELPREADARLRWAKAKEPSTAERGSNNTDNQTQNSDPNSNPDIQASLSKFVFW
jgi:hypothetical protein